MEENNFITRASFLQKGLRSMNGVVAICELSLRVPPIDPLTSVLWPGSHLMLSSLSITNRAPQVPSEHGGVGTKEINAWTCLHLQSAVPLQNEVNRLHLG